jgi:hypothetical protein
VRSAFPMKVSTKLDLAFPSLVPIAIVGATQFYTILVNIVGKLTPTTVKLTTVILSYG